MRLVLAGRSGQGADRRAWPDHGRAAILREKQRDAARGNGLAEKVALHPAAAQPLQDRRLKLRLDAFHDTIDAEILAQIDDRPDDARRRSAMADLAHEALVDLDLVDLEQKKSCQA